MKSARRTCFGRLDVVVNNVGGTARPRRPAGPHGSIVNITSAMARLSDRGFVAYATAKAALSHLTRQMAVELGPRVRVNAIAPGTIETDALAQFLDDATRASMAAATPLRRLGTPADVAEAAVFLASDASSYVTGKVLGVDGGQEQPTVSLGLADL